MGEKRKRVCVIEFCGGVLKVNKRGARMIRNQSRLTDIERDVHSQRKLV